MPWGILQPYDVLCAVSERIWWDVCAQTRINSRLIVVSCFPPCRSSLNQQRLLLPGGKKLFAGGNSANVSKAKALTIQTFFPLLRTAQEPIRSQIAHFCSYPRTGLEPMNSEAFFQALFPSLNSLSIRSRTYLGAYK
ncbi:hypothetical protein L596_026455 [Steinernema carpocapsae]|uniref:Uncharacterized protein n=1 Tax=Steinernema carpocapsae TaxID=34508 RepID=A0A4U5M1F3_STECR|nr:hypothetical protein L596_026455 [Steinernema carpocapsae]